MLGKSKPFSSFSVGDLKKAREFYEKTLGIEVKEEGPGLSLNFPDSTVFIYLKDNHVPATFTILNFPVSDIEAAVDELGQRGVRFESYQDGAQKTDAKGIFRSEEAVIAWFKDPAGNFLSLIQE